MAGPLYGNDPNNPDAGIPQAGGPAATAKATLARRGPVPDPTSEGFIGKFSQLPPEQTGVFGAAAGGAGAPDPFSAKMLAMGWVPSPKPGVWFNPETGKTFDESDPENKTGGAAGSGVGYAQLAQQAAQFERTQAFEESQARVKAEQFDRTFTEGQAQFDKKYNRDSFESDRSYAQARDQFAQQTAESQFRFDTEREQQNAQFEATFGLNQADTAAKYGMQAESMAGQQAQFDREAALAEKKNRQEILRGPSDIINRIFESRGGTSPTARVTHADLINAVAQEASAAKAEGAAAVARARQTAAQFAAMPAYKAPALGARPAAAFGAVPGAAAGIPGVVNPYAAINAIAASQNATGDNFAGFNLGANAVMGGAPLDGGVPAAASGGHFQTNGQGGGPQGNMVVTGDSTDGKPNEELVIDLPNDGGLLVIPKENLVGKRKRMFKQAEAAGDATFAGAPHAAAGGLFSTTGANDGTMLGGQWRTWDSLAAPPAPVPTVSQQELVADAKAGAGPAITSILGGGVAPAFQAAQPNLTPRKLASMTPSEQLALNSYLGVVNNTTLQDEMAGQSSLFGPAVAQPRSRMVAGGGR